jgi:hypothetical protein
MTFIFPLMGYACTFHPTPKGMLCSNAQGEPVSMIIPYVVTGAPGPQGGGHVTPREGHADNYSAMGHHSVTVSHCGQMKFSWQ